MSDAPRPMSEILAELQAAADEVTAQRLHFGYIADTIRVNALRNGATTEQVEDFIHGRASFVNWMAELVEARGKTENAALQSRVAEVEAANRGLVRLNEATEARAEAAEARAEALQVTYDDLYADALEDAKSDAQDFDGDLWQMVRGYLDELHFDWRDFMEDGVTADEAVNYIRECMNEETRRADDAETALAALQAQIDALVGAASRQSQEVFADEGMLAREAIEYMEQVLLAAIAAAKVDRK